MPSRRPGRWGRVCLALMVWVGGCTQASFPEGASSEPAVPEESLGTQSSRVVTSSYLDLRLRVGRAVAIGRTCGASNEVTPSCVSTSGSDMHFHFIAPYDGSYTFATDPVDNTNFDTVVQVTDWNTGASLGCNDNASSLTLTSAAPVNLARNQEVRITVDGKGTSCGLFQLNIDPVPSSCGACNTPPGPCFLPNGTCDGSTCVYTPRAVGSACNDSDACTLNETCSATGACVGTAVSCKTPPGTCFERLGTCNTTTGACSYAKKAAGTACDDGDSCTSGDACNNGVCYSGVRVCCETGVFCNGSCCAVGSYCSGGVCRSNCLSTVELDGPGAGLIPACPQEALPD
ncbi:hypothetical protein LZ198_17705 [Myxococcus sp. K15C18031901]|uniref:hypothetical protein n=1 Tax=Myxococcus dinghuensis TaxID=2906761 RepID=UPI0020A6E2E1|nr:hypothetical protein [Myxococcus dinghuensis]MCP3100709.1 hypothetical protein [Myxococcus dinghuensis]